MSCLALGEVDEAERLVSHVLDARKRILGQEHAHALCSDNDSSKVYCVQGYPKDANPLLTPTLETATRTLGSSHISTLMTMLNLAHAHRRLNNLEEAGNILSSLIKAEVEALGRRTQMYTQPRWSWRRSEETQVIGNRLRHYSVKYLRLEAKHLGRVISERSRPKHIFLQYTKHLAHLKRQPSLNSRSKM